MSKKNSTKVNPELARMAVERAKDRQSVYSECVRLSYRSTGRFAPGFDNRDLQAWITENMPDVFDEHGKKITKEEVPNDRPV